MSSHLEITITSIVHYLDIDRCNSSPCQNGGTCISQVEKYTCQCQPGFRGADCLVGTSNTILASRNLYDIYLNTIFTKA